LASRRFHLAARPLLPQHDGSAVFLMTHDVERIFGDIDADHGDRCVEFLRHGVLLVLSAPCQLLVLAGPEHGRTIPLADFTALTEATDAAQEVDRTESNVLSCEYTD
jgi:hypothetical protein